jgi:hypothetical protein
MAAEAGTTRSPFITAEDVQSPRRGVWVMLATWSLVIDGVIRPVHFEVTTSTGYRAHLPACLLDYCLSRTLGRVNCVRPLVRRKQHSGMSVDAWCEHSKTHCHAFHLPKAEWFARQVFETYLPTKGKRK